METQNINRSNSQDMEDSQGEVSSQDLATAFTGRPPENDRLADTDDKKLKDKRPKQGLSKLYITYIVIGCLGLIGGLAMLIYSLLSPAKSSAAVQFPDLKHGESTETTYSALTGEKLADASLATAPTYCIQTPNGTDGARPQAGLNQAGVIFEAIAEAGITRFAAIYQNPTSAVIGPIRSLRIYYLQWDTPFDCTIVHAGGSGDALAAVSAGGYKDLTEDYSYMYRGTYGSRLWNNLFTTAGYLSKYSSDHGYTSSNVKGFARMTPEESEHSRIDSLAAEKLIVTQPAVGNTSELKPAVAAVGLRLGGWADFNVDYTYDATSNKYLRSYASGNPHEVYNCPDGDVGERNPEDACTLVQMAPSVVVALVVNERRASDNYHEDIDVIGMGDAYIFQNGTAIRGTWKKSSKEEQISFIDAEGAEIKLAPGQTILTAVPSYGSVEF